MPEDEDFEDLVANSYGQMEQQLGTEAYQVAIEAAKLNIEHMAAEIKDCNANANWYQTKSALFTLWSGAIFVLSLPVYVWLLMRLFGG